MIAVLVVFIAIGYLVLEAAIAKKFELIAGEKGYDGYFWWCFWLGAAGWAMVIALPDRKMKLPDHYNQAYSTVQQRQTPMSVVQQQQAPIPPVQQRQTPTPPAQQQPSDDKLPEI